MHTGMEYMYAECCVFDIKEWNKRKIHYNNGITRLTPMTNNIKLNQVLFTKLPQCFYYDTMHLMAISNVIIHMTHTACHIMNYLLLCSLEASYCQPIVIFDRIHCTIHSHTIVAHVTVCSLKCHPNNLNLYGQY